MNSRSIRHIVTQSLVSWFKDEASSMGAAIAFYTLFSIAPILLIVIWIAGAFIAPAAVQDHVLDQMQMLLGNTGAAAVQTLLTSARYTGSNASPPRWASGPCSWAPPACSPRTSEFLESNLGHAECAGQSERVAGDPRPAVVVRPGTRRRFPAAGVAHHQRRPEGLDAWLGAYMSDWHQVVRGLDVVLGFSITTALFAMISSMCRAKRSTGAMSG